LTRVDFHFNAPDKLLYGCRLVRKIYRTGQRVLVCADDPLMLTAFDQALWAISATDFIPHVMTGDPLEADTPVLLGTTADQAACHEVLVNLGQTTPIGFARFERLIEVVSVDQADREPGRARWRFYRDRGYQVTTHDIAAIEAKR
jgi:DNA polymerase-3 subunit chi